MRESIARIGNSWTEREITTVLNLYQQIGAKNLAIRLGRTPSAIRTKAKELKKTVPRKKREQACATG
jgi:uncharacterized protein YktA (UPF0223 family)